MSYESTIREALHPYLGSGSHQIDHLNRVLSYAMSLRETYGGDADVLAAAALLHDLGRSDKTLHGEASAQKSVEVASGILESVQFPAERIPLVLQAIGEHDQPSLRPSTLEGRILKDADFLAGFGAVGIARVAMWTGESGGTTDDLVHRLKTKMAARIASLEFEQSRYHALREYGFVQLYLDKLLSEAPMQPMPRAPYIVIEGISGSGKSTQADRLTARYRAEGSEPVQLHEPTAWYREARAGLGDYRRDGNTQLLLLLTDRYLNVRPQIEAAQGAGQPVISDRSFLSSMVYQGGEDWRSPANIAHLHTLVPQPTHLFVLDVPAEEALRRIGERLEATGGARGDHETPEQLTRHRERFLALRDFFPHLVVIDSTQSPDAIHETIWAAVNKANA